MDLLVQSGPETGKVFQIGAIPQVVGRQAGTDILIADNQMSRRHAQFQLANGVLIVSDLGSVNGTYFQGQRLLPNQSQILKPGDTILLGGTTLRVQAEEAQATIQYSTMGSYTSVPAYKPKPVRRSANGWLIGGVTGLAILLIAGILWVNGKDSEEQTLSNVATTIPPIQAIAAIPQPIGNSSNSKVLPSPPPAKSVKNGKGGKVQALGLSVTFPTDWETVVDTSKNVIEGDADDDNSVYVQIRRTTDAKGNLDVRLKTYIDLLNKNLPDLKIVKAVKLAMGNKTAEAYITYTDKDDKLLHRDQVIARSGTGNDTYFIRLSSQNDEFENQADTFDKILKSIGS